MRTSYRFSVFVLYLPVDSESILLGEFDKRPPSQAHRCGKERDLKHGGRPEGAANHETVALSLFFSNESRYGKTNRAKFVVASSLQNDKIKKSYMLSLSHS
jgi:hypothetical protein